MRDVQKEAVGEIDNGVGRLRRRLPHVPLIQPRSGKNIWGSDTRVEEKNIPIQEVKENTAEIFFSAGNR